MGPPLQDQTIELASLNTSNSQTTNRTYQNNTLNEGLKFRNRNGKYYE